jgi:hypothetical protein
MKWPQSRCAISYLHSLEHKGHFIELSARPIGIVHFLDGVLSKGQAIEFTSVFGQIEV